MTETARPAHEPSAEALRWVERAAGTGARVRSASPLAGATSSLLYAVEVERGGVAFELVLRQFASAEWLKEEPDLARHEAEALRRAARAGIPAPELVAFDETGDEAGGRPSTLMTRLPGRVVLRPDDSGAWARGLAEAAVSIHEVPAGDFPWEFYPYTDPARAAPPEWSSARGLWERAIEIASGPRPAFIPRFIHRDYHPNNVLWQGGRVSGVVDWVNACRGPGGFDVTWCRQNLALLHGVAEADRFLSAYERAAGSGSEYHPYWDLLALTELTAGPPGVYEGWAAFGVEGLTGELTSRRADEYLASVLARV